MGACCAGKQKNISQRLKQAPRVNYFSGRGLGLDTAPKEIRTLNVKTLDLGVNSIKEINFNIEIMTKLQVLNLGNNSLTEIPPLTSSSLRDLDLNYNKIRKVPELNLASLKKIMINHNCLESFSGFQSCAKLEQIECSNNLLSKIPDFLCILPFLERADFSNNKIACLDIEWRPSKFVTVNLSENKIREVPEAMLVNTSLSHIRLVGNLISPEEFMKTTGVEVYLERRKGQLDKKLWEGVFTSQGVLE